MSIPKAVLVHADGTVETLPPGDGVGLYIIRRDRCRECGTGKPDRKFKGHFASNHQTQGASRTPSTGEVNSGTIVFIEEPA